MKLATTYTRHPRVHPRIAAFVAALPENHPACLRAELTGLPLADVLSHLPAKAEASRD